MSASRQAAGRTKPWERTTGPRTAAGKARSRMNATTHGDRTADRRQARREIAALLREVRADERDAGMAVDAVTPVRVWLDRIRFEMAETNGGQP